DRTGYVQCDARGEEPAGQTVQLQSRCRGGTAEGRGAGGRGAGWDGRLHEAASVDEVQGGGRLMFMLLIHVEGVPNPFGLRFKTREALPSMEFPGPVQVVTDDYGQSVIVGHPDKIIAIQLMDIAQDMDAQIEIAEMRDGKNQAYARRAQTQQQNGL